MDDTKTFKKLTTTIVVKRKNSPKQSDKLSRLFEYIEELRQDGLTGHIKVNFNQGNICKVEKYEEILKD